MTLMNWLFLLFTAICLLIVVWGLLRGGLPIKNFLLILGGWSVVLILLSTTGFLSNFSTFPPRMVIVLVIPLAAILWFTFSGKSDIYLKRIPAAWIVHMQSFRVVVELFLWWTFLSQLIPEQMTFEGRNFDILVGLTSPLVAAMWLRPSAIKPVPVIIWNILGLLLLFNIVVIAVLSMPTPMRYFTNDPANTLVATFPWVLLPGILVALALGLHLLSIKQMLMRLKN